MKQNAVFAGILLSFIFLFVCQTQQDQFPVLEGPYLGQKPPGMTPVLFAPGTITTDIGEGCSGWGNDMEYFIFQSWIDRKSRLYVMNKKNGAWSVPESLPFVDKYQVGDFTIAPDGKTLVFASNIFIEEIGSEGEGGNRDIYWVDARIIEELRLDETHSD